MEIDKQLLEDANSIIKSFKSIIDRQGKETNWEGLNIWVSQILKEQHDVLYPTKFPVIDADIEESAKNYVEEKECRRREFGVVLGAYIAGAKWMRDGKITHKQQ